jgi:flagellar protein FlbT
MALHIALKEGEMVVVNGALLRADGNLKLRVENQVTILRAREVMTAEEANTPARRLYYACMLAYLDEPNREKHQEDVSVLFSQIMEAFEAIEPKMVCVEIAKHLAKMDFYKSLVECRKLISYEEVACLR